MSSETLRLKPAEGRRVRRPDTGQLLDDAGEAVPNDGYWNRRLKAGDVVPASAPKPNKD